MRISSRAIIIKDNKLLTMFRRRIRNGEKVEYYVIPGGGLEDGETLEQNVIRELLEEMNVKIKVLGYLGSLEDEKTLQHFFHCEIIEGTVKLSGEELDRMTAENYYEPMFVNLNSKELLDIHGKEFIEKALNKKYTQINN